MSDLYKARAELSTLSDTLLAEVERRKQSLRIETYVEVRYMLNSVDDALVRSAEAATRKEWERAEYESAKTRELIKRIQKALQSDVPNYKVL